MKIFHLPDLGEGLAEAEIREWYVKAGDVVKVDQPLVSMETAKAVVDVPSPYAGKISQLHGKVNEIIKTGAPLITYEVDEATADKGSVVGKLETSEKKWDDGDVIIGAAQTRPQAVKAMPAARVLAQQLRVDLNQVTPTGPQGLITADDVKKFLEAKPQTAQLEGATEALRGVRRVMAQTMAQSHREVVPVTIVEDVDLTGMLPKTDITVRIIKAMVAAAAAEPALNAWFDGKSLERKVFKEVHIGLAVDSVEGLFVPVIKNAESRADDELRKLINEYKQSVSTRTIAQKDLQGATMTLSNFGMIAGRYATPIIVPPAVAILGCGRSREVAIPRNGQIVIGKIMPLSLTFDHRAVTGGEATRFLDAVIRHLQA
ncbi:Dihydrolipoyllysine-residue acetyltransferase component of pyruvate dehydrogenase complex [Aquicella siphonis]|uniref:Dihydrolipoamide acetyltransferase component of pyruvate dehydrogenase complex n=1 Tax=Aquicella siphonis TaxID=254247 RepID=A0A5E4PK76_9COXI|nr:dihydrolipoamide acetyltransferase family protein [Aquicella siphonis]VVC76965.1 Dihydrolipoyllysine-residue acetyltransferase component of pyruvate dehydrogenase complex [Aquicella siphonis]